MTYDTHIPNYPEPGIVDTYNFWGFYLKMTQLCTLYQAEKRAAPALVAIDIFKARKRKGLLHHDDDDELSPTTGAADLPLELWNLVQLHLRDKCVEEAQGDLTHETCCDGVSYTPAHVDHYKSWCTLCYPLRPPETPANLLNEDLALSQRTPEVLKRTFCTCLVCDQDPIVHRPGLRCPTERYVDFERRLLEPRGLRIACAISDVDDQVEELFGVTLTKFPELDEDVEEAFAALLLCHSLNQSDSEGSTASLSEAGTEYLPPSPLFQLPSSPTNSSTGTWDPNRRLTAQQLVTLERPFRRLLADYPLLVPFYLDPKETPDSPEVFCEYHTPLVPSYWSSQGEEDEGEDADEEWDDENDDADEESVWEGDEQWEAFIAQETLVPQPPSSGHDVALVEEAPDAREANVGQQPAQVDQDPLTEYEVLLGKALSQALDEPPEL